MSPYRKNLVELTFWVFVYFCGVSVVFHGIDRMPDWTGAATILAGVFVMGRSLFKIEQKWEKV